MSLIAQPSTQLQCAASPARQRVGPWRWSQHWRQVLFAHWRVPLHCVERSLPSYLEPDTWRRSAWVSLVAFRLQGVRLRGAPPLGPCSNFLELNLRTYVRFNGQPGICFLSIHAQTRLAVRLARWFTPLPYAVAKMSYTADRERLSFNCRRPDDRPLFAAEVQPVGPDSEALPESLEAWLLERYQAFVPLGGKSLCRMTVRHAPWRTREVKLTVNAVDVGASMGLGLEHAPDCWHYSDGLHAWVWPFERLAADEGLPRF